MFYLFTQNSSGGFFNKIEKGFGGQVYHLVVEADDAEHANERAQELGIYFDGISAGLDCECCGNRWYRADDEDGEAEAMGAVGSCYSDSNIGVYFHDGSTVQVQTFQLRDIDDVLR